MLALLLGMLTQSPAADLAKGQPIISDQGRRIEICRSATKSGQPIAAYVARISLLIQQSADDRDALIRECEIYRQGRVDALFETVEASIKDMQPDLCVPAAPKRP